jgi:tetratricopeptide (TPR) repeat protein
MKRHSIIIAAVTVLILLAHYPAMHAGFVWDDTALVLRDPLIRSPELIAEGFQHFLFTDATASNFYRPLQRLTYTAEYAAFGFNAHPYHLDNICLHAAALLALFLFALALFKVYGVAEQRTFIIALTAVAAWALHPLHSGVVDYISGRADSLAALFGFAGLYFAIQALRRKGRGGWKFHFLVAAALLASALSKESGLAFCAIYLALVALRKNWRAVIPAAVGIAFILTIYFAVRSQANGPEVPRLSPPAPAMVRPIIAARALAEYAGLLIAPVKLHVDRDVESHPWGMSEASLSATAWRELETVAGAVLFGALLYWLFRARKREPAVFTLLIFAGIAYLPICGLFALNATIAEHWIYVPSAFLLLAGTLQLSVRLQSDRPRFIALTIAIAWMAFLGVCTFYRSLDWQDERTFFQNTIAAGGDSARMLINLGTLEMNEGHFDKARALLQRALTKEPEQPFALLNLAALAIKSGDCAAHDFLARAKTHPVAEAQAYEMMAVLEFKESGKVDLLRLRLASRTGAPLWAIEKRYVRALDEGGQTNAAVTELRGVLATEWYRAESWALLSNYLAKLGRGTDSANALAEAQRFDVRLSEH